MGEQTQHKNNRYDMQVNKKVLDTCAKIAREYKVRFKFEQADIEAIFGYALCSKQKIVIKYGKNQTTRVFLSIFCHEIAHCLNYRNKKFFAFHSLNKLEDATRRHIQLAIRTGLRAERYTDKVGRQLMKKLFPGCRYTAFYNRQDMRDCYRILVAERMKEYLLTSNKK